MKTFAIALMAILTIGLSGCTPQAHPNQLNVFDGDTYDSLSVARATLTAMRSGAEAQTNYRAPYNTAAISFNEAMITYQVYRQTQANQPALTESLSTVGRDVLALEQQIEVDMHAQTSVKAVAMQSAMHARGIARPRISANTLADILMALQVGDTIAKAIPVAAPYADVAQLVISAFSAASGSYQKAQGKPIDLSTLAPLELIP